MSLLSVLKALGAPGSIPLLILGCLASLFWRFVWPRSRRLAAVWFAAVVGCYLVLALPLVANGISGALPGIQTPVISAGETLDALIVFDGDNRRGRVREAKRVYDLTTPKTVWILGDAWMWDAMWRAGVPYNSIRHDRSTPTTRHQIEWVRQFVDGHQDWRIALIASRLQMPRVAALAELRSPRVLLVPSEVDVEPPASGVRQFVPTYFALRVSRDALYELVALAYYRHQGWIR